LVDFTVLAEGRDPEFVRELLNRYSDTARTIIVRYGGTIEKFIGDAVMAVWGTRIAREGDAERAVRAALELVQAVSDLGDHDAVPNISARAGVATGTVAVNVNAVGEGMVAGDVVNTAARIQQAAEARGVLVDEATWRLSSDAIAYDDAGTHELKGKQRSLRLWQAQQILSDMGGKQRVDGLEAPMVGRDAELRLVKELFHACADRRAPRLVSVTGAAGVGKSRLGWEFEKYSDGIAATVLWHRGRSLPYGEGISYSALAEMVRQRLAIADDDPPAVATGKLDAGLERWLTKAADVNYVRPAVQQLLGLAAGAPGSAFGKHELFGGWRLFFQRLAEQAPVVMLVEDLHHADPGLLDFFEYLLDWAHNAPIFVLTLARPELQTRRPDWAVGRANTTALSLDPLDSRAMDLLLTTLIPGAPKEVTALVAERAEGIPLFAVEMVRMLIDRDVVQPIDGVYRVVGNDVDDLPVPATLHALLAARLDALEPDLRRLITDAAVLGNSFTREDLSAVSGIPVPDVERLLNSLIRREVLRVHTDPLSPNQGTYLFVQSMLRQVAYDTLSRRDLKARHLAIADHFQASQSEAEAPGRVEVIAAHLQAALAAVADDADASRLAKRTAEALRVAGERAEHAGAPETAELHFAAAADLFARAKESTADEVLAAHMHERAGTAATVAGHFEYAVDELSRAQSIYRSHDLARDAARAAARSGRALLKDGHLQQARKVLREALTILEPVPDEHTVFALSDLVGTEPPKSAEADRLSLRALALAQAVGLPDSTLSELLTTRGGVHQWNGRLVQAATYYREATRRAKASQDRAASARALQYLGDLLITMEPSSSVEASRAALEEWRKLGSRYEVGVATLNLAEALVASGDWDGAERLLQAAGTDDGLADNPIIISAWVLLEALRGNGTLANQLIRRLDDWEHSEDWQDRGMWGTAAGAVAHCNGDPRQALVLCRHALDEAGSDGVHTDFVIWAWSLATDAAFALNDESAVADLTDWLDEAPAGNLAPILRSERKHVTARLLDLHRDSDTATAYASAVADLREAGSVYHLTATLLDYAQYLWGCGDVTAATPLALEATSLAERLRARPLLDRAQRFSHSLQVAEDAVAGGRSQPLPG
jgi:predicted ATPase/class 3 adenylate cyclase